MIMSVTNDYDCILAMLFGSSSSFLNYTHMYASELFFIKVVKVKIYFLIQNKGFNTFFLL